MNKTQTEMQGEAEMQANMNRMYRFTRHVYDLSRKYYLLGRDRLIEQIQGTDSDHVCEVGCGTARNLIKLSKRYPDAQFYGLDASDEMLKTAQSAVEKRRLSNRIMLKQAFSQSFEPKVLFELTEPLSKIVFSYSLSIIPPWKESIDHALNILPSGAEIHIVDFGGQDDLPKWFRAFLFWWLSLFHVYHKPEILDYLQKLEDTDKGTLNVEHLYGGYAYLAKFVKN